MAYQQKENTGSLFKNDKKLTESHPNAKGSALIDGVEYWVAAWTKQGEKGAWQSLSFTRKDATAKTESKPTPKSVDELEDEIPF